MTPSQYSEANGYVRSSVVRWCREGLIQGARKVGPLWDIPADARPRYKPRLRKNRTQRDNAFDFVRALDGRRYVDANALCCSQVEFDDMVAALLQGGVIEASSHPADGKWHTGYRLTIDGHKLAALPKVEFSKTVGPIIAEAVIEGAVAAGFSALIK